MMAVSHTVFLGKGKMKEVMKALWEDNGWDVEKYKLPLISALWEDNVFSNPSFFLSIKKE
jgi:hypothetical protein